MDENGSDEQETKPRRSFRVSPATLITGALVGIATLFVAWNVQLDLVFTDTTPTGGDLGAHVWSPAYLRDTLLPEFRLSGWSPDWYAGFPAFTYYMVVPSLLVVLLDVGFVSGPFFTVYYALGLLVAGRWLLRRYPLTGSLRVAFVVGLVLLLMLVVSLPAGIALKFTAVLGMLTLPVAAYSLGRLGGLAFPGPGLMAMATVPFIFDRSFNIYGGNLLSTMAGEFAFSLGLTAAVVFLGVAARGMDTGRYRGWGAVLLALAGLLHLFAAFFAVIGTAAYWLTRPAWRATRWVLTTGVLAGLLSAFWVLPFFWNRGLLNDMGWGKERRFVAALWSRSGNFGDQSFLVNVPPMQLLVVLAVVGAVICGLRRIRLGVALSIVAVTFAGVFLLLPEGRLWNVRLLPFYYLTVGLLAAIAVSELSRLMVPLMMGKERQRWSSLAVATPGLLLSAVVLISFGLSLGSLPLGSHDDQKNYSWFGLEAQASNRHLGPLWAQHNFSGYERMAGWTEYSELIEVMEQVGQEHGCGRALWEYESERLGSYGTPMAPMLLPYWTDGCIGSMEGLYFEASATTPYHFLAQSELSTSPSRAQRELPYSDLAIGQGVGHLQDLGVRYYMAFSPNALEQAKAEPRLTERATSGPWVVFEVADSEMVVGLDRLPVVLDGAHGAGDEWLVPSVAWWESERSPHLAESGPDDWPRIDADTLATSIPAYRQAVADGAGRVTEMRALAASFDSVLPDEPVDPVQVSDIESGPFEISFTVDQVGQPVLVRASYFPNWNVSGASGPYRVSPNLMVVVPTQQDVTLTYGRSGSEWLGMFLTLLGMLGLLGLRWLPAPVTGDEPDLLNSPLSRFPTRNELVADAVERRLTAVSVQAMLTSLDRRIRRTAITAGGALLMIGVSWLSQKLFSPTTDELRLALIVWAPGVVALVALTFRIVPSLVSLMAYRALMGQLAQVASEPEPST
jgi:hypothetical protein